MKGQGACLRVLLRLERGAEVHMRLPCRSWRTGASRASCAYLPTYLPTPRWALPCMHIQFSARQITTDAVRAALQSQSLEFGIGQVGNKWAALGPSVSVGGWLRWWCGCNGTVAPGVITHQSSVITHEPWPMGHGGWARSRAKLQARHQSSRLVPSSRHYALNLLRATSVA